MDLIRKITRIACSNDCYMAVTNNDEVYSWGESLDGGEDASTYTKTNIDPPRKVTSLSGTTVGNLFYIKTYL